MTYDARKIDMTKQRAGERRKNLERITRWALNARKKCKDDQDRLALFEAFFSAAAETLDDPKGS